MYKEFCIEKLMEKNLNENKEIFKKKDIQNKKMIIKINENDEINNMNPIQLSDTLKKR